MITNRHKAIDVRVGGVQGLRAGTLVAEGFLVQRLEGFHVAVFMDEVHRRYALFDGGSIGILPAV